MRTPKVVHQLSEGFPGLDFLVSEVEVLSLLCSAWRPRLVIVDSPRLTPRRPPPGSSSETSTSSLSSPSAFHFLFIGVGDSVSLPLGSYYFSSPPFQILLHQIIDIP